MQVGEKFYCCYLLCSQSPTHKEHCYIGFTVNPRRRIRQHNGEIKNGAKKTSKKRPWEMLLFVHGFPSKKSALYFEWSWQHPTEAKHIRDSMARLKKLGSPYKIQSKIRVLYEMMHVVPWKNYPLSIRFLPGQAQYNAYFKDCPRLPEHVSLNRSTMDEFELYQTGAFDDNAADSDDDEERARSTFKFDVEQDEIDVNLFLANPKAAAAIQQSLAAQHPDYCLICDKDINSSTEMVVYCPCDGCATASHIICLAKYCLGDDEEAIIPTQGRCPDCKGHFTWPVLVNFSKRYKLSPAASRAKRKAQSVAPAPSTDTDAGDDAFYTPPLKKQLPRTEKANSKTYPESTAAAVPKLAPIWTP